MAKKGSPDGPTAREVKERQVGQMGLWAADVPIVRCFAHTPILNLSLGGKIYESALDWEEYFADRVNINDLEAPHLLREQNAPAPPSQQALLPRDPNLPLRSLDLTAYFTSSLATNWQVPVKLGNDLRNLPQGQVTFPTVDVSFDVRGVIQLNGKHLFGKSTNRVDGIKVGQKCSRIHFLHATSWVVSNNEEIGRYEIHCAGQSAQIIPIIYGKDVLDWWFSPKDRQPPIPQVAWEGVNPASKSDGKLIRIFHSAWGNPQPELEIESISFISAMGNSAPFLIAITLE
jgi:hypothetical protein